MTNSRPMSRTAIHVLYVEDNPVDSDLTCRALQKTAPHIAIDVVGSQQEALAILGRAEATRYDLVLIDRKLADGDGLSLLAHIRGRSIPAAAVIITGAGDEELVVAALKAGADDYVIKRGDYLDQLAPTIESALQRYREQALRHARPLQVLYAEHNTADIDLTRRYLDAHAPFIELHVVYSAAEALALLIGAPKPAPFDLLLLDYNLQGTNGLELIKDLRLRYHLEIPVVLVTGQGDEEIALQALRLGAADYVPKTADYLARLPLVIEDAYHRSELAREQAALRDSERRFRSLFTDSPVALLEEDFSEVKRFLDGLKQDGVRDFKTHFDNHPEQVIQLLAQVRLRGMNQAALRLYGVPAGGQDIRTLDQLIPAESWLLFSDELVRVAAGETYFVWEGSNRTLSGDTLAATLHWQAVPGYEHTLERVIVAVEDITERKRNADRIQAQLEQLNALRAIDEAISSNLDLRVTLRVLLDQVIALLRVDAAAVLLYHPASKTLEYVAQRGFHIDFPRNAFLHLGQGFAGLSAMRRQSLLSFNLATESGNFPENLEYLHTSLLQEGFQTCFALPLSTKGELQGVLEVYLSTSPGENPEWTHFLELLAGQAGIAIDNSRLFEDLQRSNTELMHAYDATIEGWTRALDLRDKETEGHTQRVVDLTLRLCRAAGMSVDELVHIRRGALLHDIGKLGVPDAILHKPGPLSDEEWELMHRHPVYAFEMLAPIAYLRQAIDIPYCHHEKWDGSGYPRGLKGEQIPLAARIFAVIDVWDALRSDRPYRPAWPAEQSIVYLREQCGRHFDPQAVDLFLGEMGLAGC